MLPVIHKAVALIIKRIFEIILAEPISKDLPSYPATTYFRIKTVKLPPRPPARRANPIKRINRAFLARLSSV